MSTSKISILIVAGTKERLQMAAMVASVAAVSGTEVRILLSMNSLPFFLKSNAEDPPVEGEFGRTMAGKKVPPFKQLLQSAVELGDAKIHPCAMAMDVLGAKPQDVDEFLSEPQGLTRFLSDSGDAQLLTF
jgi:peroxiredoxin family protein